jgi:hypothetical protein
VVRVRVKVRFRVRVTSFLRTLAKDLSASAVSIRISPVAVLRIP